MTNVHWTDKKQYGGSSALSFFGTGAQLSVPGGDTDDNTVTLVFVSAVQPAQGGGLIIASEFVVRDNGGNDLPFSTAATSFFNGMYVVPNWPGGGGYVRITWDVGFAAVCGVLIGALLSEDLPDPVPIQLSLASGGGTTAAVGAYAPDYDMILAAGVATRGGTTGGFPAQSDPNWTDVVAYGRDQHTIFSDQIFGFMHARAAISIYIGPHVGGTTVPTWTIPSAGWTAASITTTAPPPNPGGFIRVPASLTPSSAKPRKARSFGVIIG